MNQFDNNIWNCDYIKQQAQQQHNKTQEQQVIETVHKLKDFLDSFDKVDSNYKNELTLDCCAVLFEYLKKHNMM